LLALRCGDDNGAFQLLHFIEIILDFDSRQAIL
jgi:hypothetical protein